LLRFIFLSAHQPPFFVVFSRMLGILSPSHLTVCFLDDWKRKFIADRTISPTSQTSSYEFQCVVEWTYSSHSHLMKRIFQTSFLAIYLSLLASFCAFLAR